jgi:energy-coupling factor transporter transmembrane protein EcfT
MQNKFLGDELMMKLWWVTNFLWFILFVALSVFIGIRSVDGTGAEQTPELRLVAFIVLVAFFAFILLCQLGFLYFIKKGKSASAE